MKNSSLIFYLNINSPGIFFSPILTPERQILENVDGSFISEFILRVIANTAFHRDVAVQLELLMEHLLLSLTGGEIKAIQAPSYRL